MPKRETVGSVVRGNLATLWGRYRPAQNLSEDEVRGIVAERQDFGTRLVEILQDVDAPASKIIKQLRSVFHEIEKQPYSLKMPTAEEIAGRVRGRVTGEQEKPMCPACVHLGGSPGAWVDSEKGEKRRGQVPGLANDWWCAAHAEVLAWYGNRQVRHADGKAFAYNPPWCLLPKACGPIGPPDSVEFTDGSLVGPLAAYVREYLESAYGQAIQDRPCVTATRPTLLP